MHHSNPLIKYLFYEASYLLAVVMKQDAAMNYALNMIEELKIHLSNKDLEFLEERILSFNDEDNIIDNINMAQNLIYPPLTLVQKK